MAQLIGGGSPAPDFDQPLELLAACHDRIEDRIDTLGRLIAYLPEHGCDEQAQQAAANVMRYFDTAGEHHHEDEERDLFPALARTVSDDASTSALIADLREDHTRMRALWQQLRAALQPIAEGTRGTLDAALVGEFGTIYTKHIAREESELFPLAERVLPEREKRTLGQAMAQRRSARAAPLT